MESNVPTTVQVENSPTYQVKRKLGQGHQGEVYLGQKLPNVTTCKLYGPDEVAIKFESVYFESEKCPPPSEWKAYDLVGVCEGIPRVYYKGRCGKYYVMIMDLLGPTIFDLWFSPSPSRASRLNINFVAVQTLSILKTIHQKGLVHCNIKPENLFLGRPWSSDEDKLFVADLGHATTWRDRITGMQKLNNPLGLSRGNLKFRSLNAHRAKRPSRADDLESLAYMLIFLHNRDLPWVKFCKKENASRLIYTSKKEISPGELCASCPSPLKEFLCAVKEIKYGADPDYHKLISLFGGAEQESLPKSIDGKMKPTRDDEDEDNFISSEKRKGGVELGSSRKNEIPKARRRLW